MQYGFVIQRFGVGVRQFILTERVRNIVVIEVIGAFSEFVKVDISE